MKFKKIKNNCIPVGTGRVKKGKPNTPDNWEIYTGEFTGWKSYYEFMMVMEFMNKYGGNFVTKPYSTSYSNPPLLKYLSDNPLHIIKRR